MHTPVFQQRLTAYEQWKTRVEHTVQELDEWLEGHQRATPETRRRLDATRGVLRADRCRIAVMGRPSNGTTDLINALLHSDSAAPLLPRCTSTEFCPTEVLWDEGQGTSYLRLLPSSDPGLDTGNQADWEDPERWVSRSLDDLEPDALAAVLAERGETKPVPARAPGPPDLDAAASARVPAWRHAVVSLPNPLLRLGLAILELPGHAALTAPADDALSKAHALVLVLSANEGLSPGDAEALARLQRGFGDTDRPALLVALNQAQVAPDGRGDAESAEDRAAERHSVARALGLDEADVLHLSAERGLAGKRDKDEGLLRRSGLPALESRLATRALQTRHRRLIAAVQAGVGAVLEENRARLANGLKTLKRRLEDLEQLQDKSQEVVGDLLEATRLEQERYLKGVQQFQRSREQLLNETRACRELIDADTIGALLERAQTDLARSRTTLALTRAMQTLFDELRHTMQSVATESERLRKLVRSTYQGLREEHGFDLQPPRVFLPMNYRVEIELLHQEVEAFRRSPSMLLSTKGAVIRQFHQQLVSRANVLFDHLRSAFDGWIRETLQPIADAIDAGKEATEARLQKLQRVEHSREAMQPRIVEVKARYLELAKELTALRNMHNALYHDPLGAPDGPSRPRLVAGG